MFGVDPRHRRRRRRGHTRSRADRRKCHRRRIRPLAAALLPVRPPPGRPRRHRHAPRHRRSADPPPASPRELETAPTCYCGKKGCIETWLSGPGFAADHVRYGGKPARPRNSPARGGRLRPTAPRWRATKSAWRARWPGHQPAQPAKRSSRRRHVEHRAAVRRGAETVGGAMCFPTASIPGWCHRHSVIRAACAAQRDCGTTAKIKRLKT